MSTALKFGLATPSNFWKLHWPARQQTVAQIADSGFDHMFMADHVSFRNGSGTDGFVEVAGLSQLHPSLGVMTGIYLLPLRHPLPVARQLASMANLAPGRMIFGVGIGGEDPHELEVCGVNPKRRGVRANESLAIIKGLLAGESVTFEVSSAYRTPSFAPPHKPPYPLWWADALTQRAPAQRNLARVGLVCGARQVASPKPLPACRSKPKPWAETMWIGCMATSHGLASTATTATLPTQR